MRGKRTMPDLHRSIAVNARTCFQAGTVFLRYIEILHVRQDTDNWNSGLMFDDSNAVGEQSWITAELVDDQTFDAAALGSREKMHRSDQRGDRPSLLDVGHDQHGRIGKLGDTPVRHVAVA